jgi:hypothetical protein
MPFCLLLMKEGLKAASSFWPPFAVDLHIPISREPEEAAQAARESSLTSGRRRDHTVTQVDYFVRSPETEASRGPRVGNSQAFAVIRHCLMKRDLSRIDLRVMRWLLFCQSSPRSWRKDGNKNTLRQNEQ